MGKHRPDDFDLRAAIRSPSFTPRVEDVPALIELVGDDPDVDQALLRVGPAALAAVRPALATSAALIRLAPRLGVTPADLTPLLAAPAEPIRRAAAVALGKLTETEAPLLERLSAEPSPSVRRAIAEALGKVGGPRAADALREMPAGDDETRRIVGVALLRIERTAGRAEASSIDPQTRAPGPLAVRVHCRRGLELVLAEELAGKSIEPGVVAATLDGPIGSMHRARTLLSFAFPVDGSAEDALASDAAWRIFQAFTRGPIRYRLAFATGGHRRAEVLKLAAAARARRPELVNDPTDSAWHVLVGDKRIELEPRLEDTRFSYRLGDVPAASHPTIAAALARLSEPARQIVWDPFVGSGSELVECARLAAAGLAGCDLDPKAIEIARQNLAAAGVTAELSVGDALTARPPAQVSRIVTNPPLGRRVQRNRELADVLDRFVDRCAAILPRGGRLVWISPHGERSATRARAAGLEPKRRRDVDLGGFVGELQVLEKT